MHIIIHYILYFHPSVLIFVIDNDHHKNVNIHIQCIYNRVHKCVNKVVHGECPSGALCVPKIKQVVHNSNQEYTSSAQAGHCTCLLLHTTLGYIGSFLGSDQAFALLVLHLGHLLSTREQASFQVGHSSFHCCASAFGDEDLPQGTECG